MGSKTSSYKKQGWVNVVFVILFFGIASLFVMPAEAQSSQVNVPILGQEGIGQVLPNVTTPSAQSNQRDPGLARADTLIRNIIQIVLRVLQFAAVAYIVWIGAEIVTHVGNEDLLEKRRPAIAYAIIGCMIGFGAQGIVDFIAQTVR